MMKRAALVVLAFCKCPSYCGAVAAGREASSEIEVGNIRVQALSPTLIRVEPVGPRGFEDRTTFMVTNRRAFGGVPISKKTETDTAVTLTTEFYDLVLEKPKLGKTDTNTLKPEKGVCSKFQKATDIAAGIRSAKFPHGKHVDSRADCCDLCFSDVTCTVYVFGPNENGNNCWMLQRYSATWSNPARQVGFLLREPDVGPKFKVISPDGKILYDTETDEDAKRGRANLLSWPSPLAQTSYALRDYPRFFAPSWGTVPIPEGEQVDPELLQTNGYDFRNNVIGDTYVFLLGSDLRAYQASRGEFLSLAGECPLLPDFAFGVWYTAWAQYSYASATAEIEKWKALDLPLSVWALDVNWRYQDHNKDRFYDYPNTELFPNFSRWFDYLKGEKLRTYFNDHPFPVQNRGAGGGQCTPEESKFRWEGLSKWMEDGLTFWWFDHNWYFSVPPPFVDNGGVTDGIWEGLDNAAWGSHVYYNAVSFFDRHVRDPRGDDFYGGRPIALTKFGLPDWRPGFDPKLNAESPAQHRYPVWWTGDFVALQGSIESMVDSGVHAFKPYVHSDCGGDYTPSGGDYLRWTAHCTYGSIMRYHDAGAGAHHPWDYDDHILRVARRYFQARSRLTPSLIAAGQKATKTGQPFVARCDLFWPEHEESRSNQQYIFLDDILVAPIWDSQLNETRRSVWVPPGDWEDAWDGSLVRGPRTIVVTKPFERIPMWHRRDGGFLIVADKPAQRIEDQDWSSLTLELFPAARAHTTTRHLFERGTAARTDINFHTSDLGRIRVEIGAAGSRSGGEGRAWVIRVHLLPGQRVVAASVDGVDHITFGGVQHIEAADHDDASFFPLGGAGSPVATKAGRVAEVRVPKGSHARIVEFETDAVVMMNV